MEIIDGIVEPGVLFKIMSRLSKISGFWNSLKIQIAGFWKSFKFQLNVTQIILSGKIQIFFINNQFRRYCETHIVLFLKKKLKRKN